MRIRTWASAFMHDGDELCIVKVKDLMRLERDGAIIESPEDVDRRTMLAEPTIVATAPSTNTREKT